MNIITLTTDYGTKDFYAAALKGKLYQYYDTLNVVDITHSITAASASEVGFVLRYAYPNFPKGTVHLIAVQELAGAGNMLAMQMDGHYFLCADNGILSLINPELKAEKLISIDFREDLDTPLFPSRDVLTKAAAHLANGGAIGLLGREAKQTKESTVFRPRFTADKSKILGRVVYVDNFGNLITNITKAFFTDCCKERSFEIRLPRMNTIHKLVTQYAEVDEGQVLALFNAQGLLEVAVNGAGNIGFNGANTLLGIDVMDDITINFT